MKRIIVSDIHLGSSVCQAESFLAFLKKIKYGEINCNELIINGDLFDSFDFRRLNKIHWKIFSNLRKLSDILDVVWVVGNHDGNAENISHLLGVDFRSEYEFESGEVNFLCLHGDKFDEFIQNRKILTYFADWVYYLMQKIDTTHTLAISAKKSSKTFLRCQDKIKTQAIKYAQDKKMDYVLCGHTHYPVVESNYANSGCWTEKYCTYLIVENGVVQLEVFNLL